MFNDDTLNSSGFSSRSRQSDSMPSMTMASSEASLYLANRFWTLASEHECSEDPLRPRGGIRLTNDLALLLVEDSRESGTGEEERHTR